MLLCKEAYDVIEKKDIPVILMYLAMELVSFITMTLNITHCTLTLEK